MIRKIELKKYNLDKLREECGVFGISNHIDASALVALGLHSLQHRGQEGCGIVSFDGKNYHSEKRQGLVGDHFTNSEIIEKLPGKKAIGDIYDDSHIYTASEGAFCGIFYEGSENSLREVFIKSIKQSSLKRILWISNHKETDEITELDNLTYIFCNKDSNYEDTV